MACMVCMEYEPSIACDVSGVGQRRGSRGGGVRDVPVGGVLDGSRWCCINWGCRQGKGSTVMEGRGSDWTTARYNEAVY